jgi:hypothetical protein
MEPLWSPVVATGGNQSQVGPARERRKQAKFVATGCHRLPEMFHGKEGGRRFESVRGLYKSAANPCLSYQSDLHELQVALGMEPFYGAFRSRDAATASGYLPFSKVIERLVNVETARRRWTDHRPHRVRSVRGLRFEGQPQPPWRVTDASRLSCSPPRGQPADALVVSYLRFHQGRYASARNLFTRS